MTAHQIPARRRRKILDALHGRLEGRSRCLTFHQMAAFVNEHMDEWHAQITATSYRPQRKLFANVSWFGKTQNGTKITILDDKGNRILEHSTTGPYHRNSFTLREMLSEMGCGSGTTASPDTELERYPWYNPFGLPKTPRRRR